MLEQLVKKVDFSMLNILGILVENQLTVIFFFFYYTFNYLPVPYTSILMPGPHCLEYCNFVVSFEIDRCESIFVGFQDCLNYLGLLYFTVNFRIDGPFLLKKKKKDS